MAQRKPWPGHSNDYLFDAIGQKWPGSLAPNVLMSSLGAARRKCGLGVATSVKAEHAAGGSSQLILALAVDALSLFFFSED